MGGWGQEFETNKDGSPITLWLDNNSGFVVRCLTTKNSSRNQTISSKDLFARSCMFAVQMSRQIKVVVGLITPSDIMLIWYRRKDWTFQITAYYFFTDDANAIDEANEFFQNLKWKLQSTKQTNSFQTWNGNFLTGIVIGAAAAGGKVTLLREIRPRVHCYCINLRAGPAVFHVCGWQVGLCWVHVCSHEEELQQITGFCIIPRPQHTLFYAITQDGAQCKQEQCDTALCQRKHFFCQDEIDS